MTNDQARVLRQKLANGPVTGAEIQDAAKPAMQEAVRNAQYDHWAKMFMGSLGLGGVFAGLAAYRNSQMERKPKRNLSHIRDVPIPYEVEAAKTAGIGTTISNAVGSALSPLTDLGTSAASSVAGYGKDLLAGASKQVYTPDEDVSDPTMLSTYPIGAALSLYGGLQLGNKGVSALLSRLQASRQQSELEKKREEFRRELMMLNRKTAATLSRCYGHTKQATLGNLLRNTSLFAAAMALPMGFQEQYAKEQKYSDRKALEAALKMRARMRAMQQPSDLYASLEPVQPAVKQLETMGE